MGRPQTTGRRSAAILAVGGCSAQSVRTLLHSQQNMIRLRLVFAGMAMKWKNLPVHTTYWGATESALLLFLMLAVVYLAVRR